MAMVGRLLEPKSLTDEALAAREEVARMAGQAAARAKAAAEANKFNINEALNKVSEYHGVSEHFQKEWQTAKDVAEPGRPEDRLALMQRHSGEIDPANQFIPMKSKPIRWEPHVDEEVRAAYRMAAEKAIAYSDSSASQARGSGVVDVLQEQLEAERQRAAIVQEKLEAALREAQELSMRAARAEAKLEMTEAMMEKMASKSRAK